MLDDLLDEELEASEISDDELAVGIDLGTTNSVVAFGVGPKPDVLADSEGRKLQPSVVAWLPNGKRMVGKRAAERRVIDAEHTVHSAKRIIGMPFGSDAVQKIAKEMPYAIVEGQSQEPIIRTRGGDFRVPQVSAFVLDHLAEIVKAKVGKSPTHCVVTVPAHFSDARRAATRQAAELAGLQVLRILNEPTAAAVAYGQDKDSQRRIAVFDLGGGTFDISLLAIRGKVFEVVATGGDPFLGGDDFDAMIANHLALDFLERSRIEVRRDPQARPKLQVAAEQIKVALSKQPAITGKIDKIAYVKGKPVDLDFDIDRSLFERLIEPMVNRAIETTERVLAEAGVTPDRVDEAILVGGSTRVPMVERRVAELFGRVPLSSINPMEVVAIGAAMQARSLFDPDAVAPVLLDVTPHSLGISTAGGYSKVLIEKNTTIPAEARQVFSTARDNQDSVKLMVCQGESTVFDENIPVGELLLDDLPQGRRGDVKIEVTFLLDADGLLRATARDTVSGKTAHTSLKAIGVVEER